MEPTGQLVETLISTYHLSKPDQKYYSSIHSMKVLVATADSVLYFSEIESGEANYSLNADANGQVDHIQSLVTLPSNSHTQAVFSTAAGNLYLVSHNGDLVKEINVSKTKILSLSVARIRGQDHIFVCTSDALIHVFDADGVLVCVFDVPAPVFSLDIQEVNQHIYMAGEIRTESTVYIWDLDNMASSNNHSPINKLKGILKPAFSINSLTGNTLIHGSLGKLIHFYLDPIYSWMPTFSITASSTITSTHMVFFESRHLLIGGMENGKVAAWELDLNFNLISNELIITQCPSRITCLSVVTCGLQKYLFVGLKTGLRVFRMADFSHYQLVKTIETRIEVRGVEFLPRFV